MSLSNETKPLVLTAVIIGFGVFWDCQLEASLSEKEKNVLSRLRARSQ
ncbi:MAG: hypothetical protein ABSE95_06215 [Thermodesulfobacteriota bacterium]|jgi:hypothetical protein